MAPVIIIVDAPHAKGFLCAIIEFSLQASKNPINRKPVPIINIIIIISYDPAANIRSYDPLALTHKIKTELKPQ